MPAKKLAYGIFLAALSLASLNYPLSALAQTSSGSIQVDGLVAGPPPSTPPTVESPGPKTTFSTKSVLISGSCITDLIVKVYRNNFFAGSTLCESNGRFSLRIDLFVGKNIITTKQFDEAGQASPTSNTITLYYVPETSTPPLPDEPSKPSSPDQDNTPNSEQPSQPHTETPNEESPSGAAQFQLIIEYDYTLQAIFANQPFDLPITFTGGAAPYAININWGDGSNDVFSRNTTKPFNVTHTYAKSGYQTATITVSDKNGKKASLQFVLLVNGEREHPLESFPLLDGNAPWGYVAVSAGVVILLIGSFMAGKHLAKPHTTKTKR